jgi:hypothetical protein
VVDLALVFAGDGEDAARSIRRATLGDAIFELDKPAPEILGACLGVDEPGRLGVHDPLLHHPIALDVVFVIEALSGASTLAG